MLKFNIQLFAGTLVFHADILLNNEVVNIYDSERGITITNFSSWTNVCNNLSDFTIVNNNIYYQNQQLNISSDTTPTDYMGRYVDSTWYQLQEGILEKVPLPLFTINPISIIQLPNGSKYNLNAATLGDESLATVKRYIPHYPTAMSGTAAVDTSPYYCARWDATDSSITTLFDGLTIIIRVPVAGNSSYGVGLSVNGGDYHPVVYNISTSIGARYGVNSTIMAIYNSTQTASLYLNSASTTSITGVWQVYDYDSDTDTYYRLRNNSAVYINKSGQSTNRRTLMFEVDGGLSATNKTIATGTTKVPIAFKYIPYGQIRYYLTSGVIANNDPFASTGLYEQYSFDIRYAFNTGSTLTAGNPVYIRMVVNSDGTLSQDATTAGANPIVQTLPSTADNKVYVYLGRAGSTTALELEAWHPIYEYKDGAIRLWTNAVASGGGTATDVQVNGTSIVSSNVANIITNTAYNASSNKIATMTDVSNAISALPEPMIFKGSVGSGGTVEWASLPSASSTNEGFTYKVITDHSTMPICKVGDTIISNGSSWVVIPSGDEPSGTVTSVDITVPTGLTVTGNPITSSGTLAISYTSGYSIPTTTQQTTWSNKQDALTTSSITDGTIDKVIGFDSNGNIVKATQSGSGATITFVDWS